MIYDLMQQNLYEPEIGLGLPQVWQLEQMNQADLLQNLPVNAFANSTATSQYDSQDNTRLPKAQRGDKKLGKHMYKRNIEKMLATNKGKSQIAPEWMGQNDSVGGEYHAYHGVSQ